MLLTKAISEASAVLREAIKDLVPSGKGSVSICDSDSGIDVVLDWVGRPDLQALEVLAALVHKHDWARLSLRIGTVIEPVAVQREPIVYMGEHPVRLPPGAFLQPSREGQEVLIDLVLKELKALSGPLLDLFCGLGTFSLPLAASLCRPVTAIDSDQKSVEYLAATGMVKALVRDLFRNPLLPSELENYEAIVLDPPRAGGAAQVLQIAQCAPKKGPKKIVMVSCNPFTCARDARTLTDAGFVIEKITPVNQFHRSMHVELVAVFSRV
ncbi:class I SAM-dependent RNA methyltransferase [Haematospirillum jordaniae]|nr:methyltransferase [Haematospirillum jordaniae]NKD91286.1 methyltransferase [Haematospirillum jordaniae]